MKNWHIWLFTIALVACTETESIIAPNAHVVQLANGFAFTEGPAADTEGNIYFTDQPKNRIWLWTVDGKLDTFHTDAQRANGLFFDRADRLVSCADEKNRIVAISMAGEITTLAENFNGKPYNGPNDLWIAPNGTIYYTDSYYQREWWDHAEQPQEHRCVFMLQPGGQAVQADCEFKMPNGIIGTADGSKLYVSDINDSKTYVYSIQADGSLSDKALFCNEGSDGMTLDEQGNVYLTNGVVAVFNPTGEKIASIECPERPANVCFGGTDRKTLFITARTGLYAIEMNVKGAF